MRAKAREKRMSTLPGPQNNNEDLANKILGKSKRQQYEEALQAHSDKDKQSQDRALRVKKRKIRDVSKILGV